MCLARAYWPRMLNLILAMISKQLRFLPRLSTLRPCDGAERHSLIYRTKVRSGGTLPPGAAAQYTQRKAR